MSDLSRFSDETWDRFFEFLADADESQQEIEAALERRGIDVTNAHDRIRKALAEAKARDADECVCLAFAVEDTHDDATLARYVRMRPDLAGEFVATEQELIAARDEKSDDGPVHDPDAEAAWEEFKAAAQGVLKDHAAPPADAGEGHAEAGEAMKIDPEWLMEMADAEDECGSISDGWRCQYCGVGLTRETATVDHLTPRALGGSNRSWNLVACCLGCNYDKADAMPLEFLWVWGTRFRRDASRITNGRTGRGMT